MELFFVLLVLLVITRTFGEVAERIGQPALFFVVTTVVGYYAFPLGGRLLKHVKEKALDFSAMLIAALAFSVLAELLGIHFILGAFVAGVFFGQKTIDAITYEGVKNKVSGMTFGFLASVFFASIGLHLQPSALFEVPSVITLLVLFAFVGKLFGAGLAAYGVGLTATESVAVGIGMGARGAVELVIADTALGCLPRQRTDHQSWITCYRRWSLWP